MPTAVVLATDTTYHLVLLPANARRSFAARDGVRHPLAPDSADRAPRDLVSAVAALALGDPVRAATPELAHALTAGARRPVGVASRSELRAARRAVEWTHGAAEHERFLLEARADLDAALRSPVEVLVTLAREEERLERAVGREARAAEAWIALPGTPLAAYASEWRTARDALVQHHRALEQTLATAAEATVPNLSRLVGSKVAARLVAAAGGIGPLARMSASRLQLLGARRRPASDRGPRFGLLYRAERMDDVPAGRRGAFARSLAAWAAIAVRADASTRRDLVAVLLARRDRRIQQLLRRRG